MPLRSLGVRSPWILGPALLANDVVAADRNRHVAGRARVPSGHLIGKESCRALLTPLADYPASAGAVWWDVLAMDAARLTLEPVLLAAAAGAVIANRVEAIQYLVRSGIVSGIAARDRLSGRTFEVRARVVVNATGPWAGELSKSSGLPRTFLPSAWVGGLNIVLRRSLGIDSAIALSAVSKSADSSSILHKANRELFFVPWRGVTMVGTDYCRVDTDHEGISGPPASATRDFVAEISRVAPRAHVVEDDVAMVQWGVLPMDSMAATLPSKAPVVAAGSAEVGAQGLVVVVGEKLTSAPMLSVRVLNRVECELRLAGGQRTFGNRMRVSSSPVKALDGDIIPSARDRLVARYGTHSSEILRSIGCAPDLLKPIHPSTSVLGLEIVHAIRNEMAMDLEDLVLRRLGMGQAGHPGRDVLRRCAELAATEFRWDGDTLQRQVETVEAMFARHRGLAGPVQVEAR